MYQNPCIEYCIGRKSRSKTKNKNKERKQLRSVIFAIVLISQPYYYLFFICCISVCSQIRFKSLTYKLINWRFTCGEFYAIICLKQSYSWCRSIKILLARHWYCFAYSKCVYSFYSACETLAKHGLQKPVSFVLETHVCRVDLIVVLSPLLSLH